MINFKNLLTGIFLMGGIMPAFSIYSQAPAEPEAKKASVDVDVVFVTDYVFRGVSLLDNYYVQEGKAYDSAKFTPTFQPSVTVNSPVEGLSFNIWGSFATTHRDDVDSDKRFQFGPGEADLLTTPDPLGLDPAIPAILTPNGVDPGAPALLQSIFNHAPQQIAANGLASWYGGYNYEGGTPGYYKEANGLKRADEVDFTLDFAQETKLGNISMGIVNYTFANDKAKGGSAFYQEVYVSYALPMLPDLTLKLYSDVQTSNYYYNLSYGSSHEFSEDFSLDYGLAAGYSVRNNLQGFQDVTGMLGFTFKDFNVSANVAHRPDMKMIETSDPNTNLPVWLNGDSTAGDGMVEDPSRTNGITNSLINAAITNVVGANAGLFGPYNYTPRTELPRNIYWLSVGYSTTF